MELDINSAAESIQSKIQSAKTYLEVSTAGKDLVKNAANSATKSTTQLTTQLNKIKDQQKRFQREPPNSMSQMLAFVNQLKGSGSGTSSFIQKKMLEIAAIIEPKLAGIVKEETIKALGCSIEQTFQGTDPATLQSTPMALLPQADGIYIPVSSIDLFSNLKQSPETDFGKIFYEKEQPSADSKFKPYGGDVAFPMNKQLYTLMTQNNQGRSFSDINGQNYLGKSGQNLFDVQYSNTNSFGVTGDYYRIILLNRENSSGNVGNQVGEFLSDYYSSIKLVDNVDITANLINLISGAVSINLQAGFGQLEQSTKFELLIQRILGLCFDNRREIDVSGVAKIAELDGVDDSFYELTEVDLRNIEIRISNIQNGVMEFEGCDNVKLPVDYDTLINELIKFRDTVDDQTPEQQVQSISNILDTLYQNPEWQAFLPTNFNLEVAVNKEIIKQIPLAVASAVLSPKVLFPIFTLLQVVEGQAKNTYNQAVTSGNTFIQSGNTTLGGVNNIINNGVDFLKVFKSFNVQLISKIGAIFLKALYDILKRDILLLISSVISDISKTQRLKKYTIILRLVSILLILAQLIDDYRKCKSLINNILLLLKTIFGVSDGSIPFPLLIFTEFLPGTSPERSTINTIELLQGVGIPTGVLPDGSPNLMGIYNLMTHKGADKEESENGKVEGTVIVPPLTGGLLKVWGKKR